MKKTNLLLVIFSILTLFACTEKPANDTKKNQNNTNTDTKTNNGDKTIVYVNTDTLLAGYELYKRALKDIEVKKNQFTTDIEGQASNFQTKVLKAQQNAQSMTMGEIENTKKSLAQEEQRLVQYRDALMQNLANQEKDLADKINKNIDSFMKKYAEKNGYKMILSYKQGVTAWYADNSLDVTADVLKGLNEEYKSEAGSATTENKDTTKKK
ncbi:MAG: OmpH family outer membrane protein [Thermonemataceae bacterium]|nr:OmpH family outer membrane protein [Thermonemataceae bacterium]